MPYNVLKGHGAFIFRVKHSSRTVQPWGWRYSNPSKHQEQLAWGHIVISQKTWVYSAATMRTLNFVMCISNLIHTTKPKHYTFIYYYFLWHVPVVNLTSMRQRIQVHKGKVSYKGELFCSTLFLCVFVCCSWWWSNECLKRVIENNNKWMCNVWMLRLCGLVC